MSVLISNPERKKERTDADANEKEIYVAGLSKFTTKEDLMNLFKTVSPEHSTVYCSTDECVTVLYSMVLSKTSGWLWNRMDNQKASPLWSSMRR
jgi:hypothetical protein